MRRISFFGLCSISRMKISSSAPKKLPLSSSFITRAQVSLNSHAHKLMKTMSTSQIEVAAAFESKVWD